MKKLLGLVLAAMLTFGLACEKNGVKPAEKNDIKSAESGRGPNERFYTVQQKLDTGGTFYMYADLKDVLHAYMNKMQTTFSSNPQMPPMVSKGFMMANQVIDRLGLYSINDLGMSVIPDGALKRSKVFISDANGRKTGLLSLMGGQPHPFALLDRVSSDTLLLATGDFDAAAAWVLVRQIVQDLGGMEGLARLDQELNQVNQQTGLNVAAIMPTLAGEFSLIMARDPASKLTIPAGPTPLTVDSPRLTLMIRVKDDTFYQALKTVLAQKANAAETTEGPLRKILISAPPNPFWAVSPVVATDGSYVYFSTHEDYLRRLVAKPAGGGNLREAAEFKQLSQGLPTEGNSLVFISGRMKQNIQQVARTIAQNAPGMANKNAFSQLFPQMEGTANGGIMIRVNQPDGILMVDRSETSVMQLMPIVVAAPVGIMAAIAVPNFLEAQSRSKISRVKADMRTMTTALESYQIDNNAYPAWSADPSQNAFGPAARANSALLHQPTFMTRSPSSSLMTLTTPISYVTSYFADPFTEPQGSSFSYYAANSGWILWSAGPDGKFDLTMENIGKVYNPALGVPSPELSNLTYDPSNGSVSAGDIWRIKQ